MILQAKGDNTPVMIRGAELKRNRIGGRFAAV